MPELPEVEVIVRELRNKIIGEEIKDITALWYKSLVIVYAVPIQGKCIQAIDRRGKYIIVCLNQGYLIIHLRMTGQLIVNETSENASERHLRVIVDFLSGKKLYFYDARKFGRIYYITELEKFFEHIGMDALHPAHTMTRFSELINKRKGRIKTVLMDQSIVAGLGNIYADESLFRAGIHPERSADSLTVRTRAALWSSIVDTLQTAINNMGTTLANYRTTGGGFGTNQNFLMVYDRADDPCYNCKTPIKKIRINGRGTHFCPNCQI